MAAKVSARSSLGNTQIDVKRRRLGEGSRSNKSYTLQQMLGDAAVLWCVCTPRVGRKKRGKGLAHFSEPMVRKFWKIGHGGKLCDPSKPVNRPVYPPRLSYK